MKKIKTDFLIVGAGLYGCVLAERISSFLKKEVTIVEKHTKNLPMQDLVIKCTLYFVHLVLQ